MLFPELKQRRDKIRILMAQQGIDAALIACNVNLIYTYGRVVSGYLVERFCAFVREASQYHRGRTRDVYP